MIRRYVSGSPLETGAIEAKPEISGGEVPYFTRKENTFSRILKEEDIVYGLGENVRGVNKRGWLYVSDNADQPHHHEDIHSLYGSHNFLVITEADGSSVGLFLDTPGKITFDVGYSRHNTLEIRVEEDAFGYELYLFDGDSPADVVRQFRSLIGRPYLPPKWAFGHGQSRWSYLSSDEVREVVRLYRQNHIPLDSIYLDIDYMERYKDFTINRETFPDFEALVAELKEQGVRLVPIIDGGVKIEEGYETYEEGIRNGYFCKDENGEPFVVGVWPGRCHFPDMLNREAGRWFGLQYKKLLDLGIEGFWNDMNEPAIFYSEKRLAKVFEQLEKYKSMNLDVSTFFEFLELTGSLASNPEDYRSFYHNYRGQHIRHDRVHNLFGYYMTRSASEAFRELDPDKRILLFSRSSYIGMHRYGGVWMGDNKSWWQHILLNLKMLPSLNMCGFLYTGADLGGFSCDTTEDLLLRWYALGIFTPLMRNHSARNTRRQEPYQFGDPKPFADLIALRYRLLPYLYSEFMKAAFRNELYANPLGFVWPQDPQARHTEDQLMIGESIMIAPVYEQNAEGRSVYLPEEMKLVRFAGTQIAEEAVLPAGTHYIRVPLDEVVLFVRKGHILPLAAPAERVDEIDWDTLELVHFAEPGAEYELYDDDGISTGVKEADGIQKIIL